MVNKRFTYFFKAIILVMALFFSGRIFSQTPGLGTWNVINLKDNLDKHWNIFFEAQTRSQQFFYDFNYHEYKGGIGYNIAKQFNITLAGGQYVTYRPDANFKTVTNSEFRLWQQFTLSNNLGRVKIEHRYRTEQRWMSAGYRNRFRYRLNTVIPINAKKVESKVVYATFFNEIFISNERPYFERNRAFGGMGYMITENFTLQAGIINQWDIAANNTRINKHYLQLNFLFSLHDTKSNRERHPSTAD